jgi:hypothetical protein
MPPSFEIAISIAMIIHVHSKVKSNLVMGKNALTLLGCRHVAILTLSLFFINLRDHELHQTGDGALGKGEHIGRKNPHVEGPDHG